MRVLLCGVAALLLACGESEGLQFGDVPSAGSSSSGSSASSSSGSSSGNTPPPPPPHCGDPGAPLCTDGEACRGDADCTSLACSGGVCAPPSATDQRKNGTETDVDCGGAAAPACAVGKHCVAHDDCTSQACPSTGVCVSARSCRNHFGGDTCGAGEVGEANAAHEDCCLSIQPDQKPYRIDKYLVTAGRMRAFIDDVRAEYAGVPNVRAWVAAHPERIANWQATWNVSLPSNEGELVRLIGTGNDPGAGWGSEGNARGCYVGSQGAPTYWHPAEQLAQQAGDIPRAFTQEELDVKVLNCTPIALIAALCAYDGGYLTTSAEWAYAVRGAESQSEHLFPWGNPVGGNKAAVDAEIALRASYNKNYLFPRVPIAGAELAGDGLPIDRAFEMPAPGRFPLGAGPYGHADLLGAVETEVLDGTQFKMVRQYAFQEAYYGVDPYGKLYNHKHFTSHYAVGGRCSRPLPE